MKTALFLALALAAGEARAQETPPPAPPAPAAEETPFEPPSASTWRFTGDVLVRWDKVYHLTGREEFDRWRLRVRPGVIWEPAGWVKFDARLYGSVANDDNADNIRNFDNFESDGAGIDRLFVALAPGCCVEVRLGKMPNSLRSSEMVWDGDINPVGAMATARLPLGDGGNRLAASVFAWTLDEPHDDGFDTRFFGGQIAAFFEHGSLRTDVAAIYYDAADITALAPDFIRQNRGVGAGRARHHVSEFELLELAWHLRWGQRWPLFAEVSVVRNLAVDGPGAENLRDGIDATLGAGVLEKAGDVRISYTFQDVERDAVLTAVTSDDWWFHSFFGQGHRLALGVGVWKRSYVQFSFVQAKRDDQRYSVGRYQFDTVFRW